MSTHGPGDRPHLPPPSLWPIGFAVGIACILLGLVLSWIVTAVVAVLTASFVLLWVRDLTLEVVGKAPAVEPERRADAEVAPSEPQASTYPRIDWKSGGLGRCVELVGSRSI